MTLKIDSATIEVDAQWNKSLMYVCCFIKKIWMEHNEKDTRIILGTWNKFWVFFFVQKSVYFNQKSRKMLLKVLAIARVWDINRNSLGMAKLVWQCISIHYIRQLQCIAIRCQTNLAIPREYGCRPLFASRVCAFFVYRLCYFGILMSIRNSLFVQ